MSLMLLFSIVWQGNTCLKGDALQIDLPKFHGQPYFKKALAASLYAVYREKKFWIYQAKFQMTSLFKYSIIQGFAEELKGFPEFLFAI